MMSDSKPLQDKPLQEDLPQRSNMKSRKMRNFLLSPRLQITFGFYNLILAILGSLAIYGVIDLKLKTTLDVVISMTDLEDDIRDLFSDAIIESAKLASGVILFYVIATFMLSIIMTHRLIGPTYAFRRHIAMLKKGMYRFRTVLRPSDAFEEIAHDLNDLSEILNSKYGKH